MPRATLLLLVAVGVLVGPAVGCSRTSSESTELGHDIADETVVGNLPTAPPPTDEGNEGLTPDANVLLTELDEIGRERDLGAALSGAGFEGLLTADVDPAGLVTNPAGLTRLITAVQGAFDHIVEISPPDVQPAMETIRDMFTRIASIPPGSTGTEAQVNAILAEPQVLAANQAILAWGTRNCVQDIAGAAAALDGGASAP